MQQLKNFLLIALFSLFLAACGDKAADLKTDADALTNTLNTVLNQDSGKRLVQELYAARTPENKVKVYNDIIANYQKIIDAINALKIKTEEAQKVKAQYNDGLKLFINLMQKSSELTTHQATADEIKSYTELQKQTTQALTVAETALAALQKQADDAQKADNK